MLSVKAGSYWVKYADENQLGNRLFGFWLGELGNSRSKAMDVRIYHNIEVSEDVAEALRAGVRCEACNGN